MVTFASDSPDDAAGLDRAFRDALAIVRAESTRAETIGLLGELIDALDQVRLESAVASSAAWMVAGSLSLSLDYANRG